MLHTETKIRQRIEELKGYRYRHIKHFESFRVKEDVSGEVNPSMPEWTDGDGVMRPGERWRGRDRYLWLETTVVLPKEWEIPVGVFDFGLTGGGYNSGFESMLYIDGKIYQAVDTNHKEVFFKEEHFGRELTLTFRLWSGLEGGGAPREMEHTYTEAFIAQLDSDTDDLIYLSDMVLRAVLSFPEEKPERQDLLSVLDEAFLMIDWTEAWSEEFYESITKACAYLNNAIDKMDKHTSLIVSCVGHTHIDTAWLWRLKHTREKASRSFATVLRLMEQFPEYYFLHTQPQQYEYIKEDFPELYAQIKERVNEGRWEIDGGMWVEADCNIPSGESLTRQFLMGRKFMMEEFGKEPEYLWLPDVFGYSWALPQILKKSGIETFMTTKISWNQYNRMPNDTFWWKGMDGSKVLTHFITTTDEVQSPDRFYATYNGMLSPNTIQGAWRAYREKRVNKDLLICYGHGDGGGGVTREMLENRKRMDKIPGLPAVKTTTAGDYFRKLHRTVEESKQPMATWDGEMYLEYHRGTYTSQGYNKKMNRRMEELYRKAEWLTALKGLMSGDLNEAQQDELTRGWKIVLTHQFHDIIPGSSIREVYEDSVVNYKEAQKIAEDVIADFYAKALKDSEGVYTIINDATYERSGLVLLDGVCGKNIYDEADNILPIQETEDGVLVYVEAVPSMGVKYLCARDKNKNETMECSSVIRENPEDGSMTLDTGYYHMILNAAGQIEKLYDKENDCAVLASDARGNVLQIFEDKPMNFDAWDIDMFYYQKMQEITNLTERLVLENGPLRCVIRQTYVYHKSCITQDIILYKNDRRIDFKTHVDWQETQKLLKVAFPVDIRSTYGTYEVQYGNVRRANHSNTSWDRARFESVAHRWADLSERDYGVSILNDCKYGHDIHDNVMRLSLLKAATYPDYAADKGEHDFTYALLPHKGDFVEGDTVQEAFDLNQPLSVVEGRLELPAASGSTIKLSGAHVELDAFKKSEDGQNIVIRFHEYAGAKGRVLVETGFDVKEFAESDLMERPMEAFQKGKMEFAIKPYEIKTILLKL